MPSPDRKLPTLFAVPGGQSATVGEPASGVRVRPQEVSPAAQREFLDALVAQTLAEWEGAMDPEELRQAEADLRATFIEHPCDPRILALYDQLGFRVPT